jgi:hypothetical protein
MRWQHVLSSVALVVAVSAIPAHAQGKSKAAKAEKAEKAEKVEKAETKAEKKEDKAESDAFASAEKAPAHWLKGIKLTAAEHKSVETIETKYRKQLSDLRKAHMAAEKAGTETDAQVLPKVQALVDQERAEIRGAVPASAQAKFDANVAKK